MRICRQGGEPFRLILARASRTALAGKHAVPDGGLFVPMELSADLLLVSLLPLFSAQKNYTGATVGEWVCLLEGVVTQ